LIGFRREQTESAQVDGVLLDELRQIVANMQSLHLVRWDANGIEAHKITVRWWESRVV